MADQENKQEQDQRMREHRLSLLYRMLLIRRFEEKAAEEYSRSNIRGFLHLYIGEEAAGVGIVAALSPDDAIFSTYREHGHALARGVSASAIMAEMFGKQEGCSGGRGGSMHLFDVKKNFFGGNAIVGGHLPMAVGYAFAQKRRKQDAVTCCIFGEGAAAEGEFHESMNLAVLLQAPVLFVCENNRYAMGTALEFTHGDTGLEKKGEVYGMKSATADGMDVLAVETAAAQAVDYIRQTGRPFFLVCETYRFRAHSMFDAELYRDRKEVEEWKQRDPVSVFEERLRRENLLTAEETEKLKAKVEQEVSDAVTFAAAGTWEPAERLALYTVTEKQK